MAASVTAHINPDVLRWARQNARFSPSEAAKRAGTDPGTLNAWEAGTDKPTVAKLRALANAYKRPLALFYLPHPPTDFQPLKDFRRLPSLGPLQTTQSLAFEIRRAQERREIALDLYEAIEDSPPPEFALPAQLSDDPEQLALRIRTHLGITYQEQLDNNQVSLAYWRQALENAHVLVFQASGVDLKEMRGFSIGLNPFPVVVLNSKDAIPGKVFTMIHELVHIILHEGGLCLLDDHPGRSHGQNVETFANHVAGAALVPKHNLLAEPRVAGKPPQYEGWQEANIKHLARRYGASREALLRRLLICGRTTKEFYETKRAEYAATPSSSAGGFAPYHLKQLYRGGKYFARLVLSNYAQHRITANDVAEYLEVRLKHLPKLQAEIYEGSS